MQSFQLFWVGRKYEVTEAFTAMLMKVFCQEIEVLVELWLRAYLCIDEAESVPG